MTFLPKTVLNMTEVCTILPFGKRQYQWPFPERTTIRLNGSVKLIGTPTDGGYMIKINKWVNNKGLPIIFPDTEMITLTINHTIK